MIQTSEALAYNDMSVIYNNEAAKAPRIEKVVTSLLKGCQAVEKKWLMPRQP